MGTSDAAANILPVAPNHPALDYDLVNSGRAAHEFRHHYSKCHQRFSGIVAVDGLDLTVPAGSLYGFIGPNGSGKTTTLRMIMHILLPDQGEIEVLGERGTRAARDCVSYLPEERGLYKRMSVRRLLRYYGALKGARQPDLDYSIDLWLERLGLSAWIDKKVDSLSKGMAQKIQFIAGVLNKPQLLILDEPFSGLDPVNSEVLRDAVLDLKKAGTTIVFSTHDMSVAERLCDRIFMIFKGRKVLDGTLDEIQSIYGFDTIRVQTDLGIGALEAIPGIDEITDHGNLQEVKWSGDPQRLLESLMARTRITHFEVRAPACRISSSGSPRPSTSRRPRLRHVDLKKIWIVASTEFGSMIRTRSFLISVMLLPVLTAGAVMIQVFVSKRVDSRPRAIAVVDRDNALYPFLESASQVRNTRSLDAEGKAIQARIEVSRVDGGPEGEIDPKVVLDLSDQIRRGTLDAFVVVPPGVVEVPRSVLRLLGRLVSLGQPQRRTFAQLADEGGQWRGAIAATAHFRYRPSGRRSNRPARVSRQPGTL